MSEPCQSAPRQVRTRVESKHYSILTICMINCKCTSATTFVSQRENSFFVCLPQFVLMEEFQLLLLVGWRTETKVSK